MPSQIEQNQETSKADEDGLSSQKEEPTTPKSPSTLDKLTDFYQKNIVKVWLLIIIIPTLTISLGWLYLPEIFYDQFIWPYFWGTIEADAQDQTYGDVTEAYNPVNTIIYAFIVIIVLYWAYKLFKKYKIEIDEKFIIAIIPFVLIGGVSRSLEDAELFYAPTVYLFIAPIIYIFIGVVVIFLILISASFAQASDRLGLDKAILLVGGLFVILDIFYLMSYFVLNDQFAYFLPPLIPIIASVFFIFGLKRYFEYKNQIEVWLIILSVGTWFLLINIFVLFQWQSIPAWTDAYLAVNPGKEIELQPMAALLVIGLTCATVVIVYIITKALLPKYPKLKPFIYGTNLILFFGQFLDASATFVAIDYYNYVEKHVLPTFLIELFDTAAIMYLLKAVLLILVIYFIDILYKEDFKNNPTMVGLIKIAVLVLGLAPGTRDVLRLAIGV
jgi:uncharacterized membrane protein